MYNIAVCEGNQRDAEEICSIVRQYLNECSIETQLTLYEDPAALLWDVKQLGRRFDLILLETILGKESGIALARELRALGVRAKLVFVTNSPDYWREGYKVEASDYLLKPVDPADLCAVIGRLMRSARMVTVKLVTGDSILLLVDSIYWAEAFDHRTQLHTEKGSYMISGTLGELQKLLPADKFFRCHRSYIVNLDRVTQTNRKELSLVGGQKVPISRGIFDKLREAMLKQSVCSL